MNSIHYLRDEIAVVGWSCRLPGAKSVTELWSLLLEGRCAISSVPADRFSLDRFGHPRKQERGKSYTWAAGVLDDLWGFDPTVFGISPREAEQMDPQQRILLQLTWEALEDAGIRPSSIAGSDVGVFVGASQSDYGHAFFADHALADSHFATGTALAILANRISYIYDLRGPSLAVDTACSSSLVALHQAVETLRSGRIDTAIVGGINVIASPASFIAFSQASMLSPTGLCHSFSAEADGFVRAEGGAVLVLRKAAHAQASRNPVHGLVLATDVNSDGRTNGISLPSGDAQQSLLERVYSRAGIEPDRLAFIEAHGTGTAAGDPIEATALGRSIGRDRSSPLPIGSIKTNIGHLEPASGLAGVLKALLALNHGILPRSLHYTRPNPNIDFQRLNLSVADQSLLLPNTAQRCAGVNSFGFGGTNAHAIVAPGRKATVASAEASSAGTDFFALSAETKPALVELAKNYAQRVAHLSDQETATLARGVAHRREHLSHRIVIATSRSEKVANSLNAFISGSDDPHLTTGTAIGDDIPVAFVYSGNGSQWVGMGLSAYRHNSHFRSRFEQVDGHFKLLAGWSLKEALFSDTLQDRLPLTSVAQPLIFAIQSAATAALCARGLRPAAVLGHSVGEVAAAEAAGILDLRTAVKVIHFRSTNQESLRGAGRMAAVLASPEKAQALVDTVEGVEIAAINSPRAVTVAGSPEALEAFKKLAGSRGVALIDLDLDYPFHTTLMAPIERSLTADLKTIVPRDADVPFVSTVTGAVMPGSRLDGKYWWRNVREPVHFVDAVQAAAKVGARYFVEIGPRGTLLKHISDSLDGEVAGFATLSVLDRNDADVDPFDIALAKSMVNGAQIDLRTIFGPDPGPGILLPIYPWQQKHFRYVPTSEAIGGEVERHAFAGARYTTDALEWYSHIDTTLYPDLVDHKVGEQTLFPGAAFLEMALSVARQWLKTEHVVIANFEILKALDLTNGETREMMTRVSPGSNTIEIFSRPRLSHAAWMQHCRGKMLHATDPVRPPERPATGQLLNGEFLYNIANASGLHYGPAFHLVRNLIVHQGGKLVSIELAPQKTPTPFLLDPMRLDCCTQAMILLLPELHAEERGVTYIPVRLDESTLYQPHGVPQRAVMEILDKSERSIFVNYFVFASDDGLVAVLRGVRLQAVPVKRPRSIESIALVEVASLVDGVTAGDTGVSATAEDIISGAVALGLVPDESATPHDGSLLIEGWATAAAYEIASGFADGMQLDVDMLVASGRLPEELQTWLANILVHLEAAELATRQLENQWRLTPDSSLPSSASVVKALAQEHPSRAAELLLTGAVTGLAEQIASNKAITLPTSAFLTTAALDFYDSANVSIGEASDALRKVLGKVQGLAPKDRALRVLQVGFAPLAHALASHEDGNILLTVFEPDRRKYERAELTLSKYGDVTLLDADRASKLETYDLIVAVEGLHRLPSGIGLDDLNASLAPGGLLVAVEPRPSLFKDLVFGLNPNWFAPDTADYPVGSLQPGDHWIAALERAAFNRPQASLIQCGSDFASLVTANAGQIHMVEGDAKVEQKTALLLSLSGSLNLAIKLAERPAMHVIVKSDLAAMSDYAILAPGMVVFDGASASDDRDPVAALARRCMAIKTCAEKMSDAPVPLWLIFSGAIATQSSVVRPVETGAWAFSRTLANEFPKIDVRRIDVAAGVDPDVAAEQIRGIVLSDTAETEFHLDGQAVRAIRVQELRRTLEHGLAPRAAAATLKRRLGGGQRVAWQPIERPQCGSDEIEIAVEATGLNFRDLMWTLSLLPDDMLEDGFTGPTLGLECAGRVAQVGSSVKGFQPGDRVVALAASAFSTHVTVPAAQAAKLPDGMSAAGATTIPVAFLTAYYSLVTLARLRRGEWVLIHGGAGGVGMAAIQIAASRGAQVIATAGSRAKRDLLKAFGVAHVLDSRSNSFVDEVREITGSGVDVVLNSLAGEAMERSLACLRPFGRFVELGKRDYVANTHLGLRPFRKNLSYFGVDVDQLVGGRKNLGERVFAEMMRQFEKGALTPLPYSVFEASAVSEAFDLMQHSSHVGKIVVLPPQPGTIRTAGKPLVINPNGTHVITGAFGGFGLETARWLVERGARHLVLVGRSGAASAEARALVEDLAGSGVKVLADPCDVSDMRSVEKLFEKVHATMPPVVGVMHAAMVLDDAIVPNLDTERFTRVFEPKVRGAENLHSVTRALQLEYFVLFSSFTTMMGNPGQGNYVAANAYMEGLARRRRQEGLPALAIAWGPITDVGVVARNEKLQANLLKLTGVTGLRAREGLELMAQALKQPGGPVEFAVMTVSPNDGSFASDRLPILRSPTYASLTHQDQRQSEGDAGKIDLGALLQTEGIDVVRRKVSDVIVSQLARVLHSREDDISRVRPLAEIGLDSLMALELVMSLESAFGTHISLAGSAGSMTISAIADEIIAHVGVDYGDDDSVVSTLAGQHLEKVEAGQIDAIKGMMSAEGQKAKRLLS